MIKLKHILFNWSESRTIKSGHKVTSFIEADCLGYRAAFYDDELGGYDKTSVSIEWEDGEVLNHRWDINKRNSSLSQDIKTRLMFSIRKPYHLTDEEYGALKVGYPKPSEVIKFLTDREIPSAWTSILQLVENKG